MANMAATARNMKQITLPSPDAAKNAVEMVAMTSIIHPPIAILVGRWPKPKCNAQKTRIMSPDGMDWGLQNTGRCRRLSW